MTIYNQTTNEALNLDSTMFYVLDVETNRRMHAEYISDSKAMIVARITFQAGHSIDIRFNKRSMQGYYIADRNFILMFETIPNITIDLKDSGIEIIKRTGNDMLKLKHTDSAGITSELNLSRCIRNNSKTLLQLIWKLRDMHSDGDMNKAAYAEYIARCEVFINALNPNREKILITTGKTNNFIRLSHSSIDESIGGMHHKNFYLLRKLAVDQYGIHEALKDQHNMLVSLEQPVKSVQRDLRIVIKLLDLIENKGAL